MGAESAKESFVNLSALKDDDLESTLFLSEFLTRFYPHFSSNADTDADADAEEDDSKTSNSNSNGKSEQRKDVIVSPVDVISAIEYRRDVERYTHLASYIGTLQKPGFYDDDDDDDHNNNNNNNNNNDATSSEDYQNDKLDQILAKEAELVWRRMQTRISGSSWKRMSTDEDVCRLLSTLEVRLSKAISNDTLLNEMTKKGSKFHPSCSTLLNVPSGNYFSTVLPNCIYDADDLEIRNVNGNDNGAADNGGEGDDVHSTSTSSKGGGINQVIGTLPIPANALTWKELLRMSKVVGSLPTKDAIRAATKSVLTQTNFIHTDGFDPNSTKPTRLTAGGKDVTHSQNAEALLLAESSILRGSDIVALWVRAQRSTAASRHLLALFDLEEVEDGIENNTKQQQSQQQTQPNSSTSKQKEVIDVDKMDAGIPKEISFVPDVESYHDRGPCFNANYVGNPSGMKNRIEKEARMLDKLVEWAIVNQVLFTQKFMKRKIKEKIKKPMPHKRTSKNSLKRDIVEMTNGTTTSSEKESSVKRRKVTVQMSEDMRNACQAYVLKWFGYRNPEVERVVSKSTTWIKKYLKNEHNSTDRTLSRIERRSLINKYADLEEFRDVVNRLLDALIICPSGNGNTTQQEKLKKAKEDFKYLCDIFLFNEEHGCEKFIRSGGSKLEKSADADTDTDTDTVIKLLKEYPIPWFDDKEQCVVCEETFQPTDEYRACWNCCKKVKASCIQSKSEGKKLPPIDFATFKDTHMSAVLLSVQGITQEKPDFVANPIKWEKMEIVMTRTPSSTDGKLHPWALALQHTETCEEYLVTGIENILDPQRRKGTDEEENLLPENMLPMRVPHTGMVVSKVGDGPGKTAGIKLGDIIVEIEVSEKHHDEKEATNNETQVEKHVLRDIKDTQERTTIFSKQSRQLRLVLYRPSKPIFQIAESYDNAFEKSQKEAYEILNDLVSDRWYCAGCSIDSDNDCSEDPPHQALLSQMLIRRLGMEECSLPFHGDILDASKTEDGDHGVEGADGVVEIEDDSCDTGKLVAKSISLRRIDEMMTQPTIEHPFRILCGSIVRILNQARMKSKDESDRKEFAKRFLQLFVAWGLDCSGNFGPRLHEGPPNFVKAMVAPWIHDSHGSNAGGLEKPRVSGDAPIQKSPADGILSQTVFESHNRILQYESYSAYVGTMLLAPVNDHLVFSVCEKAGIGIDVGRRSIELIVLSYVPSDLLLDSYMGGLVYEEAGDNFKERWKNAEGLFFILPILSFAQMHFIQQYCTIWNSQVPSDTDLLRLEGIIALTPHELMCRLRTTQSMISAVDRAVLQISSQYGEDQLPMMVKDAGKSEKYVSEDAFSSVFNFCHSDHSSVLFDIPASALIQTPFREIKNISHGIDVFMSDPKHCTFLSKNSTPNEINDYFDNAYSMGDLVSTANGTSKLEKKKNNLPSSLLRYLDGMVSAKDSAAMKEERCSVLYSDLMYWITQKKKKCMSEAKKEDMIRLDGMIENQNMSQLPTLDGKETGMTIVLHRNFGVVQGEDDSDEEYEPDENGQYHGMGWGFELVRWSGEKNVIRVGRVTPKSPASRAGLRMHDEVKSINGTPILATTEGIELAKLLLQDGMTRSFENCDNNPTIPYLYHAQSGKRPVHGPVLLEVRRFDYHTFQQSAQDDEVQVVNPINQFGQVATASVQRQPEQHRTHHSLVHRNHATNTHSRIAHRPPVSPVRPLMITPEVPQPVYHQHTGGGNLHHSQQTHQLPQTLLPAQHEEARIILNQSHLYSPSINGSFLSLCEVVVLLHAISLKHTQLSIRLLCPRYPYQRVNDEYMDKIKPFVEKHGVTSLPQMTDTMWNEILSHDWNRMKKETGPTLFEEHGHVYRAPVERLPIDRLLEVYLKNLQRSHPPINGGDIMRIRGGGEENENKSNGLDAFTPGDSLNSIPVNQCVGRAVYGFQQYVSNGSTLKDVFVGRIASVSRNSGQQQKPTIIVEVYWFLKRGWLQTVKQVPCSRKGIFLIPDVAQSSSSVDLVKKVTGIFNYMQKNGIRFEFRNGVPFAHIREPLTKTNLIKVARRLVSDLRKSASSILGVLIDGRIVHWFESDPTAIYLHCLMQSDQPFPGQVYCESTQIDAIRAFERNAKNALATNKPSNFIECEGRKKFCSLWGFCAKNEKDSQGKPILSFDTIDELRRHHSKYHSYCSKQDINSEHKQWTRIEDPSSIKDLCADLTSHICGRASPLTAYVSDYNKDTHREEPFNRSILSRAITFNLEVFLKLINGRPDFGYLRRHLPSDKILQRGILLWARLACLFEIEDTGVSRLANLHDDPKRLFSRKELSAPDENEKTLLSSIGGVSSIPDATGGANEPTIKFDPSACFCSLRGDVAPAPMLNCNICRHPDEIIVKSKGDDGKPHGVGRSLVTDICFAGFDNPIRTKLHSTLKKMIPIKGELDVLKVMIIKLAANVPSTLYAPEISVSAEDFWSDDLLDTWIDFVSRCTNIRMVFQSFATLQYSLNKNRLPKWWRAKYCGWSSAPTILSTPTISNLSLVIFTLDMAVAEYIATTRRPYEATNRPVSKRRESHGSDRPSPESGDDGDGDADMVPSSVVRSDGEWEPTENVEEEAVDDEEDEDEKMDEPSKLAPVPIKRRTKRLSKKGEAKRNQSQALLDEYKNAPPRDRYKHLSMLAKFWDLPSYDGDWNDDCEICGQGGDLLCCEYCQNVAHQECVGLEGDIDDVDYICDECADDFIHLTLENNKRDEKK